MLVSNATPDAKFQERLAWLEDVVKAFRAGQRARSKREAPADEGTLAEVFMSPGEACVRRIAGLVGAAARSIDICVFTVTDDRISRAIRDAHRRGVKVRIVTDDEKAHDAGSDTLALGRDGVPVRVDDSPFHMHHKFAIFDGRLLLTGSYNWTRGAAENNQENLLVTDDPRFVRPFVAEFERLWTQFGR